MGRGSAEWIVVGVLVAVHCCSLLASSATLTVGGAQEWTIGPNYTTWAAGQSFATGDVLLFVYTKGAHNVVEVNKAGYDACSASNPINTYTDGNTSVTLTSGSRYFLCSFPSHCTSGMRLAVTVGAGTTPVPAPSTSVGAPPPTPAASVPAPATTPPSSSPPTPTTTTPVPSPSVGTPTPTPTPTPSTSPSSTPTPTPSPLSTPTTAPTPLSPSPASTATPVSSPPPPPSPASSPSSPPSAAPSLPSSASLAAILLCLSAAFLAL